MENKSITDQLIDCLDLHKTIKLNIDRLDGNKEDILFDPYLIGETPINKWAFIYGKLVDKNQLTTLPIPFIVSLEVTDAPFSVDKKDMVFMIDDNERSKVIKNIPEMKIIDVSEPDEFGENDESEEDDEYKRPVCPFCDSKYECEHLLIDFDISFLECKGGRCKELYAIREVVEKAFLDWLVNGQDVKFNLKLPYGYLADIWAWAKENYKPAEETINFDSQGFLSLIEYVWDSSNLGMNVLTYHYASGFAPGFESDMLIAYTDNPELIIKKTEELIKSYLETENNDMVQLG